MNPTMNNGILIIAHTPLASALRECVLHVFPDGAADVMALDVQPDALPQDTLAAAGRIMAQSPADSTLILTDIYGATPCNVAQKLVDGVKTRLVCGVNLPMLLRAVTYRHETLEALVARALAGGAQGVMQVATTAQQKQVKQKNDQDLGNYQQ
jgi:PTS system mannose-specific IIA component